jgi:hypothetical protein
MKDMDDGHWQEIFKEVKQNKKIDSDTLMALRALLDTSCVPYFMMVYVGIPEGGKIIVSLKQAQESMAGLYEIIDNPLQDKELTETWG